MLNLLNGGKLTMEMSMLKKFAGILIVGGALSACDNTVPAGGSGYFDPPVSVAQDQAPLNLVPDTATDIIDAAPLNSENILAEDPAAIELAASPTPTPAGISTGDGSLDLNAETFAEQKVKRDAAAALLEEARAKYTIIEPGTIPEVVSGVNIAEYARSTTNQLREKLYSRPIIKRRFSGAECAKFSSPDDAQRYFLANGGPTQDPLNLDPDGDGFACRWSPEPFRLLR